MKVSAGGWGGVVGRVEAGRWGERRGAKKRSDGLSSSIINNYINFINNCMLRVHHAVLSPHRICKNIIIFSRCTFTVIKTN